MGKLLEFKPEENHYKDKALSDAISIDIHYGCTPDLPVLRYSGPCSVFIWDVMKDYHHFKKNTSGDERVDWTVESYAVETKNKYLPFKNKQEKGVPFFYLPVNPNWVKNFDVSNREDFSSPGIVKGRVLNVNLKTLQELDQVFYNTYCSTRAMIPVTYQKEGKKVERYVWTYLTLSRMMGKYDPHERVYKFKGVNPQPIESREVNGNVTYELNAWTALQNS